MGADGVVKSYRPINISRLRVEDMDLDKPMLKLDYFGQDYLEISGTNTGQR